jgi:hypothetical protein
MNRLSCSEFLAGHRAHCGFYSHFTERLPYCVTPHLDECKLTVGDASHHKNFRYHLLLVLLTIFKLRVA